jgi:hypothetical protein
LGGGVVVIENGRILGGDPSFIFIGDVRVSGENLEARVQVTKYNTMLPSITGFDNYVAVFEGRVNRQHMQLVGRIEGVPQVRLTVEMIRRAELP